MKWHTQGVTVDGGQYLVTVECPGRARIVRMAIREPDGWRVLGDPVPIGSGIVAFAAPPFSYEGMVEVKGDIVNTEDA